jgi:PAS domain S-box-containing protein
VRVIVQDISVTFVDYVTDSVRGRLPDPIGAELLPQFFVTIELMSRDALGSMRGSRNSRSGAAFAVHSSEAERLKSLLEYDILDTPPDPAFDEIVRVAAQVTGAPYAYLGFVDANRLWFKSRLGIATPELPRAQTACQFTILDSDPLLIPDAASDARLPVTGVHLGRNLHCRSYLGAPLQAMGGAVGTLAVLSPLPNAFTEEHASILGVLARQVVTRLEYAIHARIQDRAIRSRQRIERALTVERNFVSAVLDTMSALVLVLDTAGRIVRFNRACEESSGYTFAELAGRAFPSELFVPEERSQALELLHQARQGSLRRPRELQWLARDGSRRSIEWTTTTLTDGIGEITFIIMTGVDMTERRRLDRMKDEFISTVSHELRTPLTSLRAALGLIGGGVLESRPDKEKQMMDVALGNCERLVRLVNDILDFERMGAGRLTMQFQEAGAAELLERATVLLRPNAEKREIVLRSESLPIRLWVDQDRILQTLGNLVGNAIKFSPQGSEVVLRARRLNATEALLSVEDQGRGIPPEKLDLIFERFQQVDASDSRDMGGAGLGLAICRNIVRQHGGRIWAESVVGKGSTFCFTLPTALQRNTVPEEALQS